MKCRYCEENVDLPFKCPFCGGYFCADHRLPENHACPELWKVRTRRPPPIEQYHPPSAESKLELPERGYPLRLKTPSWTSSTEVLHLTVGAMIVMAVGLSLYESVFDWFFSVLSEPVIILSSALVFTVIFVSHELGHKAVAKHYGLWAEFRLNLVGAALTLMSIAPTPIKIVSPGAVMIAGRADRKTLGITAFAGPFTSIALTSLFFALHFLFPHSYFASTILRGAVLGSWMALLNLIPFGILDGAKVFWWNKTVWAVGFSASIILALAVLRCLLF